MKKVLILTAAFGEGHNAAARGLLAGFEKVGGVEARIADPLAEGFGAAYDRARQSYLKAIDLAPLIWSSFYAVLDRTPLIHGIIAMIGRGADALAHRLQLEKPDAVVSTYPAYNYLLDQLGERRIRRFTVVTDSITINSVWRRAGCDRYFVPNEETAAIMQKQGVPAPQLSTLGFPVPPRFALERARRETPGYGKPLRVLYMINGGKRRAPGLVEQLLKMEGIELTVTVGRDTALQSRMEAIASRMGRPLKVYGWTSEMPNLLMTNHILIGKAGGAAVQEAIAACTPMLITQVVPGQEEGNARLLVKNRCGRLCRTDDQMVLTLDRLQQENAKLWREWESQICGLSKPDAALRIAEAVAADLGVAVEPPKSAAA